MSQESKNPHFPNEDIALKLNLAIKGSKKSRLAKQSFRPIRSMLGVKSLRPSTGVLGHKKNSVSS